VVDIDAAIGYVVAHGDPVERARLSYLRAGTPPPAAALERIEIGQTPAGGWPAAGDGSIPSVDATCFRLAELDDLGGLHGPPVDRALAWLASVQRPDGTWQEDESLAAEAPPWAMPGDPEATLYLTAVAGFWLTVAEVEAHPHHEEPARYGPVLHAAARFVVAQLRPDGTWPSFLPPAGTPPGCCTSSSSSTSPRGCSWCWATGCRTCPRRTRPTWRRPCAG
jgi:hypothetical protein